MIKNPLSLMIVLATLTFTGCSTVDSAYNSTKSIGQAAIGGTGNIVGNSAVDASRTLGVGTDAIGKVIHGAGKVVGGGLELIGGVVKGTSDIVAPSVTEKK